MTLAELIAVPISGMYTGSTSDGSDIQRVEGMYLSSCGEFWSNQPFTYESEKQMRRMQWKRKMSDMYKRK